MPSLLLCFLKLSDSSFYQTVIIIEIVIHFMLLVGSYHEVTSSEAKAESDNEKNVTMGITIFFAICFCFSLCSYILYLVTKSHRNLLNRIWAILRMVILCIVASVLAFERSAIMAFKQYFTGSYGVVIRDVVFIMIFVILFSWCYQMLSLTSRTKHSKKVVTNPQFCINLDEGNRK